MTSTKPKPRPSAVLHALTAALEVLEGNSNTETVDASLIVLAYHRQTALKATPERAAQVEAIVAELLELAKCTAERPLGEA